MRKDHLQELLCVQSKVWIHYYGVMGKAYPKYSWKDLYL